MSVLKFFPLKTPFADFMNAFWNFTECSLDLRSICFHLFWYFFNCILACLFFGFIFRFINPYNCFVWVRTIIPYNFKKDWSMIWKKNSNLELKDTVINFSFFSHHEDISKVIVKHYEGIEYSWRFSRLLIYDRNDRIWDCTCFLFII